MTEDYFNVYGLYGEAIGNNFTIQVAYYIALHRALRSGTKLSSLTTGGLTQGQIDRICGGNCASGLDSNADYNINTWYVRAGYSFATGIGEIVPYVQWDYYSNPETVALKSNGGDNEAGIADDNAFNKQTVGVVYRPDPPVAFKLDFSNHSQTVGGQMASYPEARFSASYIWRM